MHALPNRVVVPANSTVAALAWGFPGGGKDVLGNANVVLIDYQDQRFDDVNLIKKWKQEQRIIHCYFSVGTAETFRDDFKNDPDLWKSVGLGNLPQWPDEFWLDLRKIDSIKPIMKARFVKAKEIGCDAIEPDNTDCYDNDECGAYIGKPLARTLQIQYNLWQVQTAHGLGLSISLKNTIGLMPDIANYYDFAVNEQCLQFMECDVYKTYFSSKNKLVLNIEYQKNLKSADCKKFKALQIQSKRCVGSPDSGLCKTSSRWNNCYAAPTKIPKIVYTSASP